MWGRFFVNLPLVVGFQYLLLVAFGVPRFSWRYMGLREAVRVLEAIGVGAAVFLAVRVVAGQLQDGISAAEHVLVPIGVTSPELSSPDADFCLLAEPDPQRSPLDV
jgi:FlaA1/EpsC-like NDP-sugar epimerase